MAIKQILTYPHKSLEQIAETVTDFNEELTQLCVDLKETAERHKAEGLAATQIGENKRVFVIKMSADTDVYTVCINPQYGVPVDTKRVLMNEGCLSFPGVFAKVERASTIIATYFDETGKVIQTKLEDLAAVAFQHELDHLDGIVFLERMGRVQRHMAVKKLNKQKRRHKQFMKQLAKQLKNVKLENNVVTESTERI